ncbi:MAG: hypothetical protein KDB07_08575, partial [Planctomycetes bacterium]|nr:hypothetical protein [Planctomycetota bacterium]
MRRFALLLLPCLVFGACSSIDGGKIREFDEIPNLQDQSYDISTIRIGDHIEVAVAGDPLSKATVVVSDDGKIDL